MPTKESLPRHDLPSLDPARLGAMLPPEAGDNVWVEVLSAVDRTWAELVDYQERLERQNHELEDLRSFLGSILASVSDALIVASRAGEVLETSASVDALTGQPPGAWAGRALLQMFEPAARAQIESAMADATNRRTTVTVEVALIGPDGPAPLELSISPRRDERERIIGYVLTGRPLGELRQAYSQLESSHEALITAQAQLVRNEKLASLGRLLAGVAHELNNPISFVYANAHALERYAGKFETYFAAVQQGASRDELIKLRDEMKLDREVTNLRTAIEGARDGAERVRDIVEDLRRLSAEGSGEMVDFDLVSVAQVASDWVRRGSKTLVDVSFEGESELIVRGRPGHIQQVVMNLIQNASDALEDMGGAQIRITARRAGARGELCVADNGPGVSEAVAATIFDPFFTTKAVGKGTGLGLSISYKIVEEHRGRLRLENESPLGGASFCFDLPLGASGQESAPLDWIVPRHTAQPGAEPLPDHLPNPGKEDP
ncbi:two-component system sensor histidine kinase HupT/HoxJ [Rhodobacter aestuarii]|uniref:histidine kinase n=2 Tax=Rhodobacter aestuarii TaxID=453582 RepID=A0A1N7KZF2_9RHOB|nr:two-component system sensor histidine kinase HupT/HoxJ [Rhodobacter aestuarii]SIS66989.1 two-component system, NtrC family, sensor histidine kinase HupT/HoxJ [Rhodobacter aestuarii]